MTTRYPFSAIKEKLAARHGKALDFAIGQHRIPLPKSIDDWIHSNAELAMKVSAGHDANDFRDAAAAFLAREYGVEIDAACILPTPGGRGAMSAFVAYALEPGQSVFVTEPGYPAFLRLATHRHADIHVLELDPQQDFAPDLAPVSGLATPVRVIALNYPNNPTGASLSPHIISTLQDVSNSETIFFNDATYGPLAYQQSPLSMLHPEMAGNNSVERVELHSFSKLFPMGPVAASFLAGTEETMRNVSTYSEFAWSPLSLLQLKATTLCLRDADRLIELREYFPVQLEQLRRTLQDIGFDPYPAPTGIYVICPTPQHIGGVNVSTASEAAALLMDNFDLAVVPWDTESQSYLRFSSLYLPADLERLARLGERLHLG